MMESSWLREEPSTFFTVKNGNTPHPVNKGLSVWAIEFYQQVPLDSFS